MSEFRFGDTFPTFAAMLGKIRRALVAVAAAGCRTVVPIGRMALLAWKRTWKAALAIVLLAGLADGVATLVMARRVAAEIEQIRARGEYVSCKDMAGSPIPDSENGAVIYEKAFRLLRSSSGFGNPLNDKSARAGNPVFWDEARAEVRKCADGIALIEEAQKKPKCRFKVDRAEEPFPDFRYLGGIQRAGRILVSDALIKAGDGDTAGACHSLQMLIVLQESIKDEPTLIHWALRAQILQMATDALARIAAYGPVPERESRGLSDRLADIDLLPGLMDAMRGERVTMLVGCQLYRKAGMSATDCMCSEHHSLLDKLRYSIVGRPWSYSEELALLRSVDYRIKLLARPYREIGVAEWERADGRAESGGHASMVYSPSFGRTRMRLDMLQAQLRASRIILALGVYRSRFGSYPAKLDDLEQSLHWGLNLEDPFSGKDFIYKRIGKGYILYSLGEDMKDNGGKSDAGLSKDLVWKMDR